MTAAEALLRSLAGSGVRLCVSNPGTTELAFVEALDRIPEIRPVLGLHESVCAGIADGFGRMAGVPALLLLHHGPGLANAGANLHNARKANSPILTIVGDNTRAHNRLRPPLQSDLDGLAAALCSRVWHAESGAGLLQAGRAGLEGAFSPSERSSCVVVPGPVQWESAATPPASRPEQRWDPPLARRIRSAATLLEDHGPGVLLLGGNALTEPGLLAAGRVAARTSSRLFAETFPGRFERGGGLPPVPRLPYQPDAARQALSAAQSLVCVGTGLPVSFFDEPHHSGPMLPGGGKTLILADAGGDAVTALEELAELLGPGGTPLPPAEAPTSPPSGPLNPDSLGAAVAWDQPEGLIVMDEGVTSGRIYWSQSLHAPRHTLLALTGGAIGVGIPCATGAALACPDRPVLNLQADGSALYTLQGLWTQAREGLNVTTLLCSNRTYRILQMSLRSAGVTELGPASRSLTSLADPAVDWLSLAQGLGVPGVRVDRAETLVAELAASYREPGPRLIEAVLA